MRVLDLWGAEGDGWGNVGNGLALVGLVRAGVALGSSGLGLLLVGRTSSVGWGRLHVAAVSLGSSEGSGGQEADSDDLEKKKKKL